MNRAGVTLLEATVALVIVGTVSIGALSAFAAESRAAARERSAAPAVALARERVAALELLDQHALHVLPDSMSHGEATDGAARYAWTATTTPSAAEHDLYEIAVDVRWTDGAFALRTRTYRPADLSAGADVRP